MKNLATSLLADSGIPPTRQKGWLVALNPRHQLMAVLGRDRIAVSIPRLTEELAEDLGACPGNFVAPASLAGLLNASAFISAYADLIPLGRHREFPELRDEAKRRLRKVVKQ